MAFRLSALLLLVAIGLPCRAQPENTLRVLSYNIHHGAGTDRKLDLARIADVIKSVTPDIVALQEVDQRVPRSHMIDQPAELARLTGMHAVFHGNIPLQGGLYGNAILSRFPIKSSEHILLPNHNQGEQRGLIVATFDSISFPQLRFIATHFDHRREEIERVQSADRVNKIALNHPLAPLLLAGDLNDSPGSETLRVLQKYWQIAGPESPTIPVGQPKRQIDFILFRPNDRWEVLETHVLPESVASDHHAILSVLRLRPRDPDPSPNSLLEIKTADGTSSLASTSRQWQQRRSSVLNAMHSIMGRFPEPADRSAPEVTIVDESDCGDYVRRKIRYASQPGNETSAYLCIPKTALSDPARRHPAVLCLHPTDNVVGHDVVVGLGGKPNRQYASELASRGYVTLSPSYPLLADYQPNLEQLGWDSGTLLAVWDNMRGIDLLQSLPYVDGKSIGAIGHSLGGHNAVYTAAFDQRIKAVVSSCGLDSYRDYYDGDPSKWIAGRGWTQTRYMPKLAQFAGRLDEIPFDFDEILATLAPRDVLVIAPLHDSNFRSDSVDRLAVNARPVFELHGATERLQVLHPDCDHDFPLDMRLLAYSLFDSVLANAEPETTP